MVSITGKLCKAAPSIIKGMGILCLFLLMLCNCCEARAAKLLFVDAPGTETADEAQIKKVGEYLGLEFDKYVVHKPGDQTKISAILRNTITVAIVIHARCLHHISREKLIDQITEYEKRDYKTAVIIKGISKVTNPDTLFTWSAGVIASSSEIEPGVTMGSIDYADLPYLNQALSNQKIAVAVDKLSYFQYDPELHPVIAIGFKKKESDQLLPIMIKTKIGRNDIFFITDFGFTKTDSNTQGHKDDKISTILPVLIPIKYACGTYCWHSPGVFANLTIDDPFLVEPYGNLSYAGLLREMERSRFHTTIAFIPWNYNRSQNDVVEIIKDNPAQYSISVHGSDHGLKEFQGAGEKGKNESKIVAALARMEAFKRITGIEYDKVMVFPRNPGTADTMQLFKKYNFLGTANWTNIPSDMNQNTKDIHCLREAVFNVGGFPSLKRYNPEFVSDYQIALTIFFDSPVLFEAHQHDFQAGIDWFNRTAEKVNRIYPNIEWVSLGKIFQNLYMKKKKDDRNWDIRMYSRHITIENRDSRNIVYHIKKDDDFSIPIKRVLIEGSEHPFEKSGNELIVMVTVPPMEMRDIVIEYENDLIMDSVDLSKIDLDSKIVRWLVEFRDLELSRTGVGRLLSGVIYPRGETKAYVAFITLILFVLIVLCLWISRRRDRAK